MPFPATRQADDSQAFMATIQHQGLPNVEARLLMATPLHRDR